GGPLQGARGTGEEPVAVRGVRVNVLGHAGTLLAGVTALRLVDLLGPRLDGVGDLEKEVRTLARGGGAPRLERCGRRRVGGVHVLGTGDRGLRVGLAGARVDDVGESAALGVHELTVHEVLQTDGQGMTSW